MIKIADLLYELCEDEHVYEKDYDLFENGIMDSMMLIDLISRLEDEDIEIQITQVDHNCFRSVKSIEQLIQSIQNNQ